jgi:hypothetical protein
MPLTYQTLSKLGMEKEYYSSFRGYSVPMVPEGKIDFASTRSLVSFYIVQRNAEGQVGWFAKVLVERQSGQTFSLMKWVAPGSQLFFDAEALAFGPTNPGWPGSPGGAVAVNTEKTFTLGKQVDYKDTAGKDVYYEGEVEPSGLAGQASLLFRKVVFLDHYLYGSTGIVKERKLWKSDGSGSVWTYTERGKATEKKLLSLDFTDSDLDGTRNGTAISGQGGQ